MMTVLAALVFLVLLLHRHRTWRALSWPEQALKPVQFQAHRGYCQNGAQENTLASFVAARDHGYLMFELDVRLSRDQVPVVFHDKDLSRLAGRSEKVQDLSAEELARWVGAPTLEEVLVSSKLPPYINIELKSDEVFSGILEEKVAELVRRQGCEHRVMFSSFNPLSLWRMKRLLPDVPRALLATQESDPANRIYLRQMWLAPYIGIHALHLDCRFLNPQDLRYWQQRQIPVALWTVNDEKSARDFLRAGAFSIISDNVKS